MTAVPLLSGILGSQTAEFKASYPLNLEPVIIDSKISRGQLRAAPGVIRKGVGPGVDRGGITWNDQHYRVMGTKLVRVSSAGAVSEVGDVGPGGRVAMDYSFDRLGILSGTNFYFYNETSLSQVTDEDLGLVIDMIWIDGYFMLTDGTYIVVNELNDPTQVKPLKYGSAEEDPDAITGLIKYRDEAYVLGRFTIEVLQNIGGNGFPFITRKGAGIPFGCISPQAKCLFGDGFAFVGSARSDSLNIFIGGQGTAQPIGTAEVCEALAKVVNQSKIELESRESRGERRLILHLPGESWAFLLEATKKAGEPVWHRLKTDESGYRLRNGVAAYGQMWVGDSQSGNVGTLSVEDSRHWGEEVEWSFDCGLIYNEGFGGIVHSVELAGLPGRGYTEGVVFLSMTRDGETFSQERAVTLGRAGARGKRIQWRPHSRFANYLGLRFRGWGMPGIAACEVKAQGLAA